VDLRKKGRRGKNWTNSSWHQTLLKEMIVGHGPTLGFCKEESSHTAESVAWSQQAWSFKAEWGDISVLATRHQQYHLLWRYVCIRNTGAQMFYTCTWTFCRHAGVGHPTCMVSHPQFVSVCLVSQILAYNHTKRGDLLVGHQTLVT